MFSAGTHRNITLLTFSEVEKVDGFIGNFSVRIRKKARRSTLRSAQGGGLCEEKCPKKVVDEVFRPA